MNADVSAARSSYRHVSPGRPSYLHVDIDGDKLLVTDAAISNGGPGVYISTSVRGSVVPVAEVPALIDALSRIADHAVAEAARKKEGK